MIVTCLFLFLASVGRAPRHRTKLDQSKRKSSGSSAITLVQHMVRVSHSVFVNVAETKSATLRLTSRYGGFSLVAS